jgi:hypothetical protein
VAVAGAAVESVLWARCAISADYSSTSTYVQQRVILRLVGHVDEYSNSRRNRREKREIKCGGHGAGHQAQQCQGDQTPPHDGLDQGWMGRATRECDLAYALLSILAVWRIGRPSRRPCIHNKIAGACVGARGKKGRRMALDIISMSIMPQYLFLIITDVH